MRRRTQHYLQAIIFRYSNTSLAGYDISAARSKMIKTILICKHNFIAVYSIIHYISMTLKIIWIRNITIMSKKCVDLIYLTDMMTKRALLEAPVWRPIRLQCQNGSVVCSPGVWCSRSPISSRFISLKGWDSNTQKTAEKMLNNCCSISNIHTKHFLESFLEWCDPTSINPAIRLENPPFVRIIDDSSYTYTYIYI